VKFLSVLSALVLSVFLMTSCAVDSQAVPSGKEPTTEADIGGSPDKPEDPKVAKVGEWARADDGVMFRVAKLTKGTVGQYAAGGSPGDPAVILTVQLRNSGSKRFDLSAVDVTVRLGKDGTEADKVFQDGVDGSFDGTLAPGRTVTAKYMFAAQSRGDLKVVSVEIAPGYEYDSFTFEGGI
jgi:hypothetical protein